MFKMIKMSKLSIDDLELIFPFETNLSKTGSGLLERKFEIDKIFQIYVVSLTFVFIVVLLILFLFISTKKSKKICHI